MALAVRSVTLLMRAPQALAPSQVYLKPADGSAKRLEPMSSPDRKAIHDALADFEGVVTRSEGDDPRRCVVIAPVE